MYKQITVHHHRTILEPVTSHLSVLEESFEFVFFAKRTFHDHKKMWISP